MTKLYYTPPTDEQFEDMRSAAIHLWAGRYSHEPDYMNEKIGAIKDIQNVGDNFMYIFAMFDWINQKIVAGLIKSDTRQALKDRLIDGGAEEQFINFL